MLTSFDGKNTFSRLTLLALAGVTFNPQLSAQEPVRAGGEQPAEDQAAEEPAGDHFINPSAREDQTDSPFYGLIVEQGDKSAILVTDVKFGSDPWEAGLRPGDHIVAFADASADDLGYERFLEAIDMVLDRTNESDQITVTLMRDGEPFRTLMNGFGPSLDELQERREESQEDRDEILQDAADDRREREEGQKQAETEDLDELSKLYEASMSGKSMSSADRRRQRSLESSVFASRGSGVRTYGNRGGMAGASAGAANRQAGSLASSGQGSRFGQLRSELTTLRQQASAGSLSNEKTQRLNSLERLSQAVGSRLQQSASNAQFSPQTRTQYRQLQAASRSGNLSTQQRRQLNQFRQRERMIRSSAGSNANLPFGGRGAAGAGNANLTARQIQAAPSATNGATATQNGSGIGNAGPVGGSGAGIGTAGSGPGAGTSAGSGAGAGAGGR